MFGCAQRTRRGRLVGHSFRRMSATRIRNIFDPDSAKPFKLSRSRLEVFLTCPRCFYLDRRLGIERVCRPAFTLNTATDTVLKCEFDRHRADQTPHPLMVAHGIDAVPLGHEKINEWRENFKGVQYLHEPTNLLLTGGVDDVWVQEGTLIVQYLHERTNLLLIGAVDDVWVHPEGTLIVVDYKSTSTQGEVTLEGKWKEAYRRQIEFYQWLLRRNGFPVSDTGYFVYVNADTRQDGFEGRLVFDERLLPYAGNDVWVEQAVVDAHECLMGETIPEAAGECAWCRYREAAREVETGGRRTGGRGRRKG